MIMAANEFDPLFEAAKNINVVVPPRVELVLDQKQTGLHLLTIQRFDQLQALRLVPPELDEGAVRQAIAGDDVEARDVAKDATRASAELCACGGRGDESPNAPLKRVYRRDTRTTYIGVRKTFHPRLAALMTDTLAVKYNFFDLHPSIVYGWANSLAVNKVIKLWAWLLNDVEIMNGATLKLQSSVKYFSCAALKIHVGGKLVVPGGVKIWCQSAQGDLP
jgi:hypothetical protein